MSWKLRCTCFEPPSLLPAPDDDLFISCYECGNTFPVYQTFAEPEIKDRLETVTSPFDSNESVFLSTDSRARQRKKSKGRTKSKRFRQKEKIDSDLTSERGIVNMFYDSST